jgi:beta-barrel assembly-enhancing protease
MRSLVLVAVFFFVTGCAAGINRKGVISQELPLTVDDLAEIRSGDQNHEKVLWEYRLYDSPKLQKYCNTIAANIAAVSTRPHLPYRVILLDHDEVNVFGGPGGYIYITRGLFQFIESEAELASVIAHEITHVANYQYSSIPHLSKVRKVYGLMLQGSELARNNGAGVYGTAANYGLKGLGKAAPMMAKRFTNDDEIVTDEKAIDSLAQAGYDPRAYQAFIERISKIEMDDVSRFVRFLNTHPPFQDRRDILNERVQNLNLSESGKLEFKKDLLSEVRQTTVNAPTSILFEPALEPRSPVMEVEPMKDGKSEKMMPDRKRWSWY